MSRGVNIPISAIAECDDCDWFCDDYTKSQSKARSHSIQKDHDVCVEVVKTIKYKGSH